MRRRDFLKHGLSTATGLAVGGGLWTPPWVQARDETLIPLQAGWIDDEVARINWIKSQSKPFLAQQDGDIRDTGKGKKVFLWKYFEEVIKNPLVPHLQEIGDCLESGTLVTMSNSYKKEIERIKVGEYVLSHLGQPQKVTRTIRKPFNKGMVCFKAEGTFEDVVCTPDHLIFVNDGQWKPAGSLSLDDSVFIQSYRGPIENKIWDLLDICPDAEVKDDKIRAKQNPFGLKRKLQSIIKESKVATTVYCIDVENDLSFIANGYSVHNCVSHSFGLGVDILSAVQMLMHNKSERWVAKAATEIIYAGSRVEVGGGKLRRDGSMGSWAGEFINKWGVLHRKRYLGSKYDYTEYSGQVARTLGRQGVPNALEPLCRLHPVRTVSLCRSWNECRDAIANGHLVAMCSNVGFKTRGGRDRNGFLTPSRRPWMHSMLIAGIDDQYKRPGGLIINSWGNWTYGPKRYGQPEGSFWADASVIDRGLRQGDSIAMSAYLGYPRFDLDYRFW